MGGRGKYFLLFILLVAVALISRICFQWLYLPDVLTASFVYFFLRMIFIHRPPGQIAWATIIFTFLVEFTQLYHSPFIEHLRSKDLGRFVLGHAFDWRDIISYILGVLLAWWIDKRFSAN